MPPKKATTTTTAKKAAAAAPAHASYKGQYCSLLNHNFIMRLRDLNSHDRVAMLIRSARYDQGSYS